MVDDLKDEVEINFLVHELEPIAGAIGEQVLYLGPDHLGTCTIRDTGRSKIDHQQASVHIDGNVALAADDLLTGVVTSCLGVRHLDALEQEALGLFAKPAVNSPPVPEMDRQHPPATA
ncbi:hypothetical protein KSAC_21740 [Komagataeibacter saccharivorans]|nr:hypothetical protein KSAC_21740 [Komagataeibacter saccharivorans]